MTPSCLEFYHHRTKYLHEEDEKTEEWLLGLWGTYQTEFMNSELLVQTLNNKIVNSDL